ncbi:MAG: hypothetical protein ACK50J_01830 [Planctomyces sp.]
MPTSRESFELRQGKSRRREFLKWCGRLTVSGVCSTVRGGLPKSGDLPPVRTITKGPRHHWFGYYDKLEFDVTGRYVLGMEVDFEHRSPRPDDVIRIGMVDLQDGDRWIELGTSSAWCWQQGCMLQWIPGFDSMVLWNDREDGQYVCRILDVATGKQRTIPTPIYAIHPSGKSAITTDFRRLGEMRPGYGYNGIPDPYTEQSAPKDSGIGLVDLSTGVVSQILSIAEVAEFGPQLPSMKNTKHWFNHLLFNPDGSRFVFLHRWRVGKGRESRMLTADSDGSRLRVLDANGLTSHFFWRDPNNILAWKNHPPPGTRLYLFADQEPTDPKVIADADIQHDGHCSYLPGGEWILNDSYPDAMRIQNPFLYHIATRRMVPLGHFLSPPEYTGEWRCDTHPRFSRDGRFVVIDSPHSGEGRQLHLIDLRPVHDA